MMGFSNDVDLRILQKAEIKLHKLPMVWYGEFQRDAICYSGIAGNILIPRGFLTDGGSVPRFFWRLIDSTDPDILYPAFAHDFLYSTHGGPKHLKRRVCDKVLREQMKALKVRKWKIAAVYLGVRLFGWHAWNNEPMYKLARTPLLTQK
jgi:hypothetical protein